ncbi:MAG: hypothetical protein IPF51_12290 [Dehalococcoidia bacterium]|uniref:hypothetical protein n=1 Tax=Candidatus Amarobacter glycogenicus TaxID=3140699 RepID=UPI003134BBB2|nr:hypothetical protein [Dehalococcoidia bacterium]
MLIPRHPVRTAGTSPAWHWSCKAQSRVETMADACGSSGSPGGAGQAYQAEAGLSAKVNAFRTRKEVMTP